ncbi:MAG: ribose ABC transporter permease [Anaerolineales bacterium]|nr:ribose ABC transporter permease [Anaerolineales bacterium]
MRSSALSKPAEIIRRLSVLGILLLICLVFALGSEEFLTASNLINVALQTSIIAIVAIGMSFVIFTAGIDLSVGSVMALSGALAAGVAVRFGMDTYIGISIGLAAGVIIGAINGLLIIKGGIPPFVATLSMLAIARGLTLVYTEGRPIAGLDERFIYWGTGQILGIPLPVIIMIVIAIIAHIVTRYTPFGLHVYSTGGNEETTRLAGISPDRIKMAVYMISGFLAALGGILLTARLWSAQPNAAVGWELDAIAAPVLGGTSLFGGVGSIGGTVIGAFIIGVLSNGLNLMGVPSYYQQVIKGLVLILAVTVDLINKRRR